MPKTCLPGTFLDKMLPRLTERAPLSSTPQSFSRIFERASGRALHKTGLNSPHGPRWKCQVPFSVMPGPALCSGALSNLESPNCAANCRVQLSLCILTGCEARNPGSRHISITLSARIFQSIYIKLKLIKIACLGENLGEIASGAER